MPLIMFSLKATMALGRWVINSLISIGEITILFVQCLALIPVKAVHFRREIIRQLHFIGVGSVPVIATTGAFAGAVFAYTLYNQLVALDVGSWAGAFMLKMLTWHFGPVLIGLVLAGRVGCAITAEIGTMNVTEQVDALDTMGTDPVRYLVVPRLLASFVMTPVLTVFSMIIGIAAGLFMTVVVMGAEYHYQWSTISDWMVPYDYVQGLSKGLVFGVAICLICCRNGLKTTGGAEGVGKATTSANVASCIAILIINLVMSIILFYAQPIWDYVAYILDQGWMAFLHLISPGAK